MAFESCRKQPRSDQNWTYKLFARPWNADKFCDCMSFEICAFAFLFFPRTCLIATKKYTHTGTRIHCETSLPNLFTCCLHVVCENSLPNLFACCLHVVYKKSLPNSLHVVCEHLAKSVLPNCLHVVCMLFAKLSCQTCLHVVYVLSARIPCQTFLHVVYVVCEN